AGAALAQPGRRVLAITGDGEMLMGLGSLAVVGDQAPRNFAVLVLDNEQFGETGHQRGLTAGRADIAAVAKAVGFTAALTVTEQGATAELARLLFEEPGPVLAVARVAITEDPWTPREKDGATLAHRFRTALGLERPRDGPGVPSLTLPPRSPSPADRARRTCRAGRRYRGRCSWDCRW